MDQLQQCRLRDSLFSADRPRNDEVLERPSISAIPASSHLLGKVVQVVHLPQPEASCRERLARCLRWRHRAPCRRRKIWDYRRKRVAHRLDL